MLKPFKQLRGCVLNAFDGEIGTVREFYFDDDSWTVRYLVVDTGFWLDERQVLIAPKALGAIDVQQRAIEIQLSKERIRESPPFDSHKPISRQYEEELRQHYAWNSYRSMAEATGWGAIASASVFDGPQAGSAEDSHLRSTAELLYRYSLLAEDGEVGHVYDFIIDEQDWSAPYMIVRAGDWLFGKSILVGTEFVKGISSRWAEITVNLLRFQIKETPAYDSAAVISG